MNKEELKDRRVVFLAGMCGMIAALMVGIGELALHYTPTAQYGDDYKFMLDVPDWRMDWGHFLSIFFFPLYFLGYWHLFKMLTPASLWARQLFLLLGIYSLTIGSIWLGSRVYLVLLVQAKEKLTDPSAIETFTVLLQEMSFYNETLLTVVRIGMLLVSILFIYLVATKRSYYPRWMALFNPIFLVLMSFLLYFIAPKIGGFIMPAAMNVAHFVLFSFSTYFAFQRYSTKEA